ncbi:hypothetical protein Tco_1130352 [Tanacetum coccineum]
MTKPSQCIPLENDNNPQVLPILLLLQRWKEVESQERTKKYMEEVLNAMAPFHRFPITYLPNILNSKAEVLTELATRKLEFLNQEVSMSLKTRPSVEMEGSSKGGNATGKATMRKPNYIWETNGSN